MYVHRFRPHQRQPWHDPKYGYRNVPEYKRQRQEALLRGEEAALAVELRWSARWQEKLKMQNVAQNT